MIARFAGSRLAHAAWVLAAFACGLIGQRPALGQAVTAPAAVKVKIGFYVNAIRYVDWDQRRFCADVYWWIRYPQPASVDGKTREATVAQLEAIEFVNADTATLSQKLLERKTVATPQGPEEYVHYRTVAIFHFDADFHRYPFDRQVLPIIVEHETLGVDAFDFVDDTETYARSAVPAERWSLGDEVTLPDFTVTGAQRTVSRHRYDTTFGDPTLAFDGRTGRFEAARVTVAINIRRVFEPFLVKIMIPLVICMLLPYLVFYIPAVNLEVATGLTVTSLLACVAIQLTVVPGLPDVGYVVMSDVFFYLAYLLAMLAMAQTVWTYTLEKRNPAIAQRLDIACRFAYPAIFLIGFVWIVLR
jgi:hypothetical protein